MFRRSIGLDVFRRGLGCYWWFITWWIFSLVCRRFLWWPLCSVFSPFWLVLCGFSVVFLVDAEAGFGVHRVFFVSAVWDGSSMFSLFAGSFSGLMGLLVCFSLYWLVRLVGFLTSLSLFFWCLLDFFFGVVNIIFFVVLYFMF